MKSKNVGYKRKGYNWAKSIKTYKQTGRFRYVAGGSGHRAGENWGDEKSIDPTSQQRKYSKNSPSFDEGVYLSKQKRQLAKKMTNNYYNLGGKE